MEPLDLRKALNAISDVIINRPPPIREFDQIYMKVGDMLLQTEHVAKWLSDSSVVFIGDGDAIGVCLMYLRSEGILGHGPREVHVVDFDERVVNSVQGFAKKFGLENKLTSELYNVADPLPEKLWQRFDAFYTNPPFGSNNGGRSVQAFINRGIEAVKGPATGCVVVADYPELSWSADVLQETQKLLLTNLFTIVEMVPEFHHYHLDDNPGLTSCSMVVRRREAPQVEYSSGSIDLNSVTNFYGRETPLKVRYVKDLRKGGAWPSKDYEIIPFVTSPGS